MNAARALFGDEPIEVSAMSAGREDDPRFEEIDEHVSAVLRFPDERIAQFLCSFGAYDHSHLTLVGEKGRLQLEPAYEYATGLKLQIEIQGKPARRQTFAKRDQVAAELEAFSKHIREGSEPEPSGEEGLADMRVLDAIQRAIESREVQPVEPVPRTRRPSKRQGRKRPAHGKPPVVHAQSGSRD